MPRSRIYLPCRECGADHENPRSSSICNACGIIEAAQTYHRKGYEGRERKRTEAIALDTKRAAFDNVATVQDMKRWIVEYMPELKLE